MTANQFAVLQAQQGKGLEKVMVFLVLAASIVGIWYFGFRKPTTTTTPPTTNKPTTQTTQTSQTQATPSVQLDIDKQLQLGSKGDEVKALQTLCNKVAEQKGVSKLSVDGDFGKKTDAFVAQYFPPYLTLKTAKVWAKSMYNID